MKKTIKFSAIFVLAGMLILSTACEQPTGPSTQGPFYPPNTYIIEGSGTEFTATYNGEIIGTENRPIQNVIDAINMGNGLAIVD